MNASKYLTCGFCKDRVNIGNIGFPVDLFDMMQKYRIEQVIWLCSECKLKKDRVNTLDFVRELTEVKAQLTHLSSMVMANMNMNSVSSHSSVVDSGFDLSSSCSSLSIQNSDSFICLNQSNVTVLESVSVSALKRIIGSQITIDEGLRKQNKKIIENFREAVITELKSSSPLFEKLYQKTYHTGSSYEGLRITDPNEFDIDLVLNFPFKTDVRKIVPVKKKYGFASYMLVSDWLSKCCCDKNLRDLYIEIDRHFVEDNYIMPANVKSWMQSVIDKINVHKLSVEEVDQIRVSQSGPAKTFKLQSVYHGHHYEISVDLVPVILMQFQDAPNSFNKSFITTFKVPEHMQFWFMVPKEYKGSLHNSDSVNAKRLWRLHFPGIEKYILHDRGCVKPVIKLLKLLRDRQRWDVLSSYYLKTVVLRMVIDKPNTDHWKETNMPSRLMEALEHLSDCLFKKEITHVFFVDNLLENTNKSALDNINDRLKKVITGLQQNVSEKIEKYFCSNL